MIDSALYMRFEDAPQRLFEKQIKRLIYDDLLDFCAKRTKPQSWLTLGLGSMTESFVCVDS